MQLSNEDSHGLPGLKRTKRLWVEGYIAQNQSVDVYVILDAGAAQKVGTIKGNGTYVDTGQAVTIGSLQIGVYPIGGPNSVPIAYHYIVEIILNSSKYEYFTTAFMPTGIGYFSVQRYSAYNVIPNVEKLPQKYRATPLFTNSGGGGGGTPVIPGSIYTETPQGLVNGVNQVYTVTHSISTVINFYINGEEIDPSQYKVSGQTITFVTALDLSLAGTVFQIVYV